jgi:hypothetical protein
VAADRSIELSQQSYDLLVRESERRGIAPEALADELVQHELAVSNGDLDRALTALAQLRQRLPEIDALALTRAARDELDQRSA